MSTFDRLPFALPRICLRIETNFFLQIYHFFDILVVALLFFVYDAKSIPPFLLLTSIFSWLLHLLRMVLLLVARPLISGVLSFLEFIWFFVLIIVVDHRLKRLIDFLVISVLKTTRGDNFISVFETPLFGVPEVRFLRYSVEHVLGLLSIFLSFIRPVKLYHFLLLLFLIPFICISGRFLNTIFNLITLLLLKSLLLNLSLVFYLGSYHIDHVFGYFSVIFCGP